MYQLLKKKSKVPVSFYEGIPEGGAGDKIMAHLEANNKAKQFKTTRIEPNIAALRY